MEFIAPISVADFTQMIHNIMNMDKETLHTMAYACYLYVMMDRFNAPSRKRAKR